MNKMRDFRLHQAEDKFTLAAIIEDQNLTGRASRADVMLASANAEEGVAAVAKIAGEIAKATTKIKEQRALNEAKIARLSQDIKITERQIALCTILAPTSGRVIFQVCPGIFVEKGDVIFEVIAG